MDDKRIAFCLKLWLKELKEERYPDDAVGWVITTLENEILNGDYCNNDEYKKHLETGKV